MAHVHFTQSAPAEPLHLDLLHHVEVPIPIEVTQRVHQVVQNASVGGSIAKVITRFGKSKAFSLENEVGLIGAQGQLLWPNGSKEQKSVDVRGTHLQSGEISVITDRTGLTTIGNFQVSQDVRMPTVDKLDLPDVVKQAVRYAVYTCEGFVSRPVVVSQESEVDEWQNVIGHMQAGDNHFELRRRVIRFWGNTPPEQVEPVAEMIARQ